jgi:hypothetical protein
MAARTGTWKAYPVQAADVDRCHAVTVGKNAMSVHGLSMVGGAGLTKGENSVALAVSVRSSLGAALVWQSSADSPG